MWKFLKKLLATECVSIAVSLVFYTLIVLKYPFYNNTAGTLMFVFSQAFTIALMASRTIRFVCIVALPSLSASRLRSILIVLLIDSATRNSINNVISNIQGVTTSAVCMSSQVKAAAAEIKEATLKNAEGKFSMEKIQYFVEKLKPLKKVHALFREADDILDNAVEWTKGFVSQMKDVVKDCDSYALSPFYLCVNMFENLYYDCQDHLGSTVCEPVVRFPKKICNPLRLAVMQCEIPRTVKKHVEEGYDKYVKTNIRKVVDLAKDNIYFRVADKTLETLEINLTKYHTYDQIVDSRIKDFKKVFLQKLAWFRVLRQGISIAGDVIVVAMIGWPVFNAWRFARKATRQLRDPDAKPIEKRLTDLKLKPLELAQLMRRLYMTKAALALPISMLILDAFVYTLIGVINMFLRSGTIPASFYKLNISGQGFLASLLSALMNMVVPVAENTMKQDAAWRECFPPPNYPPAVVFILVTAGVCLLLVLLQTFISRLKPYIAEAYLRDDRAAVEKRRNGANSLEP